MNVAPSPAGGRPLDMLLIHGRIRQRRSGDTSQEITFPCVTITTYENWSCSTFRAANTQPNPRATAETRAGAGASRGCQVWGPLSRPVKGGWDGPGVDGRWAGRTATCVRASPKSLSFSGALALPIPLRINRPVSIQKPVGILLKVPESVHRLEVTEHLSGINPERKPRGCPHRSEPPGQGGGRLVLASQATTNALPTPSPNPDGPGPI